MLTLTGLNDDDIELMVLFIAFLQFWMAIENIIRRDNQRAETQPQK